MNTLLKIILILLITGVSNFKLNSAARSSAPIAITGHPTCESLAKLLKRIATSRIITKSIKPIYMNSRIGQSDRKQSSIICNYITVYQTYLVNPENNIWGTICSSYEPKEGGVGTYRSDWKHSFTCKGRAQTHFKVLFDTMEAAYEAHQKENAILSINKKNAFK